MRLDTTGRPFRTDACTKRQPRVSAGARQNSPPVQRELLRQRLWSEGDVAQLPASVDRPSPVRRDEPSGIHEGNPAPNRLFVGRSTSDPNVAWDPQRRPDDPAVRMKPVKKAGTGPMTVDLRHEDTRANIQTGELPGFVPDKPVVPPVHVARHQIPLHNSNGGRTRRMVHRALPLIGNPGCASRTAYRCLGRCGRCRGTGSRWCLSAPGRGAAGSLS